MARTKSNIPSYKRGTRSKGGCFSVILKAILWFFILTIGYVVILRFVPPPITATMIGDLVGGRGLDKDWMNLTEMDRDMVDASIAAEDSKFCQHSGFDWDAIQDAAKRNASGGRIRGGSTISQQTAKNVFLWQGGGYFRKGVAAYFTFLIETIWGKRRIMEVYLNVAETGIGTYGANAESMRYFGHDASAMSADEASRIAAILPLPKKRGAIAPKGFTRRYGNSIEARIGVVGRDGLDACVYAGRTPPPQKAPPKVTRPTINPGDEYETATPPPPEETVDDAMVNAVIDDPLSPQEPVGDETTILPEATVPPETAAPSEPPPPVENGTGQ